MALPHLPQGSRCLPANVRFLVRRSSLFAFLWLCTICVPPARAAANAAPLAVFVEEDPSSLDTVLNTPYGWQLAPLTQGYLFTVDDRGRLVPDLCREIPTRANGGISADGKTISYRIRTGRWSDGAPFDARDVAFTADALRNPATNVPDRSTVDRIASVAAPRADLLVVKLKAASAPFVSSFLTLGAEDPFAIVPRHVAARYANLNATSLDTHPVGLGPFRLQRWLRGERLEFVRNAYYWRGPAAADEIVVRVEPSATTRLLAVRTGDLDVTYLSGLQVDEARAAGLPVVLKTTNVVDYLQFNLGRPALRSRSVRQGIARAIDRTRLASTIYRGLEEPTDTGQFDPTFAPATHVPAYDPAAARRELAGVPTLDFAIAGAWRSSSGAGVLVISDLQNAGLIATLHSYAPSVFWAPAGSGGILESGRFDLALTSWSPGLDPDRSYLFDCDARPPAGGNAGRYCNPAFDAAEARGASTYDVAARRAAYRTAHAILIRDLPIVPLGFEVSAYAISRRFENFKPNVLGRDYWNAWEWKASSP
jgi:peptide/nickel transport system substrate-binding protein